MIGLSFRSRSGWSRQQARQYLLSTSSASNRKLPAQRLTEARASGREQDTTPNVNKTSTKQPNRSGGSPLNDGGGSSDDGVLTRLTQLLAEVVASPLFYLVAGLAAVKLVASTGEQSASILAFAAAPIVLLTALSKSSLGKQVQDALNERLPELEAQAAELRRAHAAARQSSRWYGARRPRLPGSLGAAPHLTGDVAGDYGFDPLGFSAEAQKFAWNYEAELLHGRWAMLGVVGCLVPEALSMRGVDVGEPVWWKVGAAKLKGDLTFNWGGIEGFRIAGKQGIWIIAACQAVLMGGPEYARYVGIKSLQPVGVFLPGEQVYPGGAPFDPLSLSKDADSYVDQSVREVKNGRVAMVAMLGFFAQAALTRQGPLRNALDFAADPAHNNIAAYLFRHDYKIIGDLDNSAAAPHFP